MSKSVQMILSKEEFKTESITIGKRGFSSWSALSEQLKTNRVDLGITPATLSAIGALQSALRAVIVAHEQRLDDLDAELLGCPSGEEPSWAPEMRQAWWGLGTQCHEDSLILAVQRHNPALEVHASVLDAGILHRDLQDVLERSLRI